MIPMQCTCFFLFFFLGEGECVPAGDMSEVCLHPRLDPNPMGKGKELSQGVNARPAS